MGTTNNGGNHPTGKLKYIGPDYGSAIILPAYGKADPKKWSQKRIKETLKEYKELIEFFGKE